MVMSRYYEKVCDFKFNTYPESFRTVPIDEWVVPINEWVSVGCIQPGNKVFLFKEKNGKLFQTGETIQYGSLVKVNDVTIFIQYFYKGKIKKEQEFFARVSWESNQHIDLNKSDRYIRANLAHHFYQVGQYRQISSIQTCRKQDLTERERDR